jgi:extracellular elastinolytic metalloproteinase
MRPLRILLLCLAPLWGQKTNNHRILDLDREPSAQTEASVSKGERWLRLNAAGLGLDPEVLDGVYLAGQFKTAHNGVTHLRYRQSFHGADVYNADWVVNLDREGRVLNTGGFLYARPAAGLALPSRGSAYGAMRAAAIAVNPEQGEKYLPVPKKGSSEKAAVFDGGGFGGDLSGEPAWFGFRGQLRPAWLVEVMDANERDNWLVVVDAATMAILEKTSMTLYQRPPQGLVFDGSSPQPNPTPGVRLTAPPPVVPRVLVPFTGDPAASPRGWVANNSTTGNNTIAGLNPLGISLLVNPATVSAANGDFSFPLELGPGAPSPLAFPEASVTNLFYWVNRSHDLFYAAGFDEAAGNFQQDNFNRGGTGGDPMYAYAQFAHAGAQFGSFRNAFYTTRRTEDGQQAGIHMFLSFPIFGPAEFFTDGSYDNEVIIHEYTHGVSTRLVRQLSSTFQGGAMGEAFSDFFAIEFTTPEGAPLDGVFPAGEYFIQGFGLGIRAFPYTTNMEINPIHYGRLGSVNNALGIHDNGGIWVMALMEMRANLVRQFGEREGRRRTRLLVIDGMKLSPPAPSMIDMRDAILLADRAGFKGESQRQIWEAFARRGLGAVAQTADGNSFRTAGSFATPSREGKLAFFETRYVAGEEIRVALYDENLTTPTVTIRVTSTSGDIENLVLRRTGSIWLGRFRPTNNPTSTFDGLLSLLPYDHVEAHYMDYDTGSGPKLIQISAPTEPPPFFTTAAAEELRFPNETRLNLRLQNGVRTAFPLPFPFPFFGEKRNFVNIWTNGLLTFDPFLVALCKDGAEFPNIRGIAPLWTEARTSGAVQPDEDVYVSQAPDAITFRWVAETAPTTGGVNSEALNFAATLRANGTIEFRYGSGNRNIPPGFATLCGSGPVVGVSNGKQTYSLLPGSHYGRVTLENAPLVRLRTPAEPQSLPRVRVETPVEGETFSGVMIVRGLVTDETSLISSIDAVIDGAYARRAAYPQARADICNTERLPGCPNIGFMLSLDLNALRIAPGRHTLRFRATTANGAFIDYPAEPYSFQVAEGAGPQPVARIENPTGAGPVSGTVAVAGYVYLPGVLINVVDLMAGNVTVGRVTYGDPRDAVCAGLGDVPNCPRVGFRIDWNTRFAGAPTLNGEHDLRLRIIDQTGRVIVTPPLARVTVRNPVEHLPTGTLESVNNNDRLRGVVRVAGFAYDPDGRVATVAVLLNGTTVGVARLGLARPDICANLPDVAACPNIGYEFNLNTTLYPNGEYTLGVRIIDDRNNAVVVPRIAGNGLNIVIDNR